MKDKDIFLMPLPGGKYLYLDVPTPEEDPFFRPYCIFVVIVLLSLLAIPLYFYCRGL